MTLVFRPVREFAHATELGSDPLVKSHLGGVALAAGGSMLMYGEAGVGKTTLAIDMAVSFAAGDSWLGILEPTRRLRVSVIENEGPRSQFRNKLADRLLPLDPADPLVLDVLEDPWPQFSFADSEHRASLGAHLEQQQTDILVAGPLSRLGMEGAGTLDDVRRFDEFLLDLRRLVSSKFAIVLVHHPNRAGNPSGAWEGAVDTLLRVRGRRGATRLNWEKCRWSSELHRTSTTLAWAPDGSYEVRADPLPSAAVDKRELIIGAVRSAPGASWSDVRAAVPGKASELQRIRDELLAAGILVNTGGGSRGFALEISADATLGSEHKSLVVEPAGARSGVPVPPFPINRGTEEREQLTLIRAEEPEVDSFAADPSELEWR
jgi:hypothetical protein